MKTSPQTSLFRFAPLVKAPLTLLRDTAHEITYAAKLYRKRPLIPSLSLAASTLLAAAAFGYSFQPPSLHFNIVGTLSLCASLGTAIGSPVLAYALEEEYGTCFTYGSQSCAMAPRADQAQKPSKGSLRAAFLTAALTMASYAGSLALFAKPDFITPPALSKALLASTLLGTIAFATVATTSASNYFCARSRHRAHLRRLNAPEQK